MGKHVGTRTAINRRRDTADRAPSMPQFVRSRAAVQCPGCTLSILLCITERRTHQPNDSRDAQARLTRRRSLLRGSPTRRTCAVNACRSREGHTADNRTTSPHPIRTSAAHVPAERQRRTRRGAAPLHAREAPPRMSRRNTPLPSTPDASWTSCIPRTHARRRLNFHSLTSSREVPSWYSDRFSVSAHLQRS